MRNRTASAPLRAAFYRGTQTGLAGLYNRLIRWWTRSQYSHVELVFSTGHAASSSFSDGGVRFKLIDFDPSKWNFIDLPPHLAQDAWKWFEDHRGLKYDLLGNLQFIVAPIGHEKKKWFCSESVAAALGIPDPWRYDPGTLASALTFLSKPAQAGFFTTSLK